MADDTSEALKIWEALRPMIDTEIAEKTRSCVRTRKMVCTTAPNGSVIGVAEPFGNEVKIPYSSSVSNAQVGDAVWVQWYYDNASTMLAISFGDGSSQKYLPLTGGTVTGSITSTRNGLGFYSRGTSEAAGFSTSNATTGRGVSMQINAAGTNRGIYDNSGSKWMMYCDANDNLRFSGVTDATKGDLGITDLEERLGNAGFVRKSASPSSNVQTFTFTAYSAGILFVVGAVASLSGIWRVSVTTAGSVSYTKMDSGQTANIALSNTTNKLTVTNNSSGTTAYLMYLRIDGNMPT